MSPNAMNYCVQIRNKLFICLFNSEWYISVNDKYEVFREQRIQIRFALFGSSDLLIKTIE